MTSLNLSIHVPLLKDMHDPSIIIENLIRDSMEELIIKFRSYGNSYLDIEKLNETFWNRRLTNEISEYVNALTPQEKKRKLQNLFNLTFMAYYHELAKEAKRE